MRINVDIVTQIKYQIETKYIKWKQVLIHLASVYQISITCKYVPCPRNITVQVPVHKRGWHRSGTYDEQMKDHLETPVFLQRQPPILVKYVSAHQSNLDSLDNQQRSEASKKYFQINEVHYAHCIITLVPLSTLLFISWQWFLFQHCLQWTSFAIFIFPNNLHIQQPMQRMGRLLPMCNLHLLLCNSLNL